MKIWFETVSKFWYDYDDHPEKILVFINLFFCSISSAQTDSLVCVDLLLREKLNQYVLSFSSKVSHTRLEVLCFSQPCWLKQTAFCALWKACPLFTKNFPLNLFLITEEKQCPRALAHALAPILRLRHGLKCNIWFWWKITPCQFCGKSKLLIYYIFSIRFLLKKNIFLHLLHTSWPLLAL